MQFFFEIFPCNFSFFRFWKRYTCDYTCGDFVVFDLLDLSIFWIFRSFGYFDVLAVDLLAVDLILCRPFVVRPYWLNPNFDLLSVDLLAVDLLSVDLLPWYQKLIYILQLGTTQMGDGNKLVSYITKHFN
jgi:hypothetical protein